MEMINVITLEKLHSAFLVCCYCLPILLKRECGMKKVVSSCVLLVISALFFVQIIDAAPKKPWTFIVYMAAANDLNPYAPLDLQEIAP